MSSRSILRNTAVVAVLTALSRMLGLVREMFQSRLIGAGVEQSAFAVAFALPNMARRMFGEGALTAAFVPVFKGELEADATHARATRLARAVMTMSLLMLAAGVVLAWCLIGGAFWAGLDPSGKWGQTLDYARILIPYMLFICAAAFGMGVLNAFGRFAAAALMTAACRKESADDGKVDFLLTVRMPISVENPVLKSIGVTFTDVATGGKTDVAEFASAGEGTYTVAASLLPGSYNVDMSGVIVYTSGGAEVESYIEASREGVAVAAGGTTSENSLTVETTVSTIASDDFVIEEIFFTGSLTPEGMQYYGDQYIKITNNSDRTLYADGLMIMQSAFLTTDKYDYNPDVMDEYFSINSSLMIPGSGTDYPVAAGASVVVAITALDHTQYNANSIDLSNADFEYFNPLDDEDVDNPEVPNVICSFLEEGDYWTFHNRGFKSYAIGRLGDGVTAESFAADYYYAPEYELVVPGFGSFPMDTDAWKFPNSWVIDAVNLSIEEQFAWIVTDPSLDSGWTYCGKVDGDQTRYGKSVCRIGVALPDGRTVLKDTNNSTADFTPEAVPSLM